MNALENSLGSLLTYLDMDWVRAGLVLCSFLFLSGFAWLSITSFLKLVASKLEIEFHEVASTGIRLPVAFHIFVVGLLSALSQLHPPKGFWVGASGFFYSLVVLVWMVAIRKVVRQLIVMVSLRNDSDGLFCKKTLPLTTLVSQALIFLFAGYFLLRAWGVDATGWLASAGILGVAVGFAAQNTLADILAGISILIDPPFEVGDFVALEGDQSGRVKSIGLRTTRVWTLNDVEVVLPNSLVNSRVVTNATRGPAGRERLQIPVQLEYGEDPDFQAEVLHRAVAGLPGVMKEPAPRVKLRELADSGIVFYVEIWVEHSEEKEPVRDRALRSILKGLAEAELNVPFPRQDLSILRFPGADQPGNSDH